jgi:hypothetical protein
LHLETRADERVEVFLKEHPDVSEDAIVLLPVSVVPKKSLLDHFVPASVEKRNFAEEEEGLVMKTEGKRSVKKHVEDPPEKTKEDKAKAQKKTRSQRG